MQRAVPAPSSRPQSLMPFMKRHFIVGARRASTDQRSAGPAEIEERQTRYGSCHLHGDPYDSAGRYRPSRDFTDRAFTKSR